MGGKWNFDQENRHSLSQADLAELPSPKLFNNDVTEILERLQRHQVKTLGTPVNPLGWPVNRRQARDLLAFFCQHILARFGRFQDAMTQCGNDSSWSLYHSRLSFALNAKLIGPREVVSKVIAHYRANQSELPLSSVEGFIRQIIGWREYVRLIYWQQSPNYGESNFFSARRQLPAFFWSGDTKMNCLRQTINQSLHYAYAHHIQRLMVTGNFCLLAGIDPDAVDDWYLGIYIDAIEWVEQPNTRGMSQFADGGIMATKPYAASGNYIHKMSDYCKHCHYNVKLKTEHDACPFNSLYWHFLQRHKEQLAGNGRMGLMYKQWDKKSPTDQQALIQRAQYCLQNIAQL